MVIGNYNVYDEENKKISKEFKKKIKYLKLRNETSNIENNTILSKAMFLYNIYSLYSDTNNVANTLSKLIN
jgi:hypothetical protein